ncbi:DUF748 domain-containing protein [Haliea sp. E17]|uniref:DUF748 domain-containing protein n=1 Tax=Haliea sp. E17 TaxID=3401576 RepID=UPI003AB0410F
MLKTTLKVLAAAYIAYLALVVLVIIPAANFLAPRLVEQYLNRELQSDAILFNPFTLAAQVRGVRLLEPDGDEFLSLHSAVVDLSLESLVEKGLVLDAVAVQGLRVDVRRLADGNFNFSDMFPPDSGEEAPPAEDTGLPAITINKVDFEAERIDYTDEAREDVYSTYWEHLDLHVTDLTTVHDDEHDPYSIELSGEDGGLLRWTGDVSLPEQTSAGKLDISHLQLRPVWRFAKPWLNFELQRGEVHISGDYRLDWSAGFTAAISKGEFELKELSLVPQDPNALPDTGLQLGQLLISDIAVDTRQQRASIGGILLDGLAVDGWSEGPRASLADMLAPVSAAADPNQPALPDPNQPAAAATAASGSDTAWTANIASVRLQDGRIGWRSEYTEPALMQVQPLTANIENLNWPLGGNSPLQLALTVNGAASVSVDGALQLEPGSGDIDYSLSGLPLDWFNPNLPAPLHARITGGELGVEGKVTLADFLPTRIAMDGEISGFSGRIVDTEESLTSWDSVRWEQLAVDLPGQEVVLARLVIKDYRGRLHIAEDGTVNASNVWREQLSDTQAQAVIEDTSADSTPWRVQLPQILITGSELDFQDESLPIHFRTVIGDLNGEIAGIDSSPGASATIDLKGSVDGYAPVSLGGTAAPFAASPALDLELDFTGVDMATLTPYSGTYAGYAIERGLLTLNLHYSLENERLKGDNKVLIDQLRLGEKIDSDKALDLPLKLGLALLTDASGVIDLQVPVEGDVDSPEFDLSSVIVGAFVNLLTKAVTAPFNLLANLVGSEEDLQRMPFPVGSAEISPVTADRLAQLTEALQQRPQLTLVIKGRLNLAADRAKLREAALREQLLEAGLSGDDISDRSDAYLKAIDARYKALAAGEEELPNFRERYARVLEGIPIGDDTLLDLAQQRATATKAHVVNTLGLPADRAVIDQSSRLKPEEEMFSGVELDLDG